MLAAVFGLIGLALGLLIGLLLRRRGLHIKLDVDEDQTP